MCSLKHYCVVVYHICWNNIGILWLYYPLHDTACSHNSLCCTWTASYPWDGEPEKMAPYEWLWMAERIGLLEGEVKHDMNGCISLVWPTMTWWHSAHAGSVDWIALVFHRIAKRECGFGFTVVKMVYHCALGHFESLWRSLQLTCSSAGFWSFHYGRWLVMVMRIHFQEFSHEDVLFGQRCDVFMERCRCGCWNLEVSFNMFVNRDVVLEKAWTFSRICGIQAERVHKKKCHNNMTTDTSPSDLPCVW